MSQHANGEGDLKKKNYWPLYYTLTATWAPFNVPEYCLQRLHLRLPVVDPHGLPVEQVRKVLSAIALDDALPTVQTSKLVHVAGGDKKKTSWALHLDGNLGALSSS